MNFTATIFWPDVLMFISQNVTKKSFLFAVKHKSNHPWLNKKAFLTGIVQEEEEEEENEEEDFISVFARRLTNFKT